MLLAKKEMKKANPSVGQVVEVVFRDHCEGQRETIICRVWGVVIAKSRNTVAVRSWDGGDDENSTDYAIDRRTVDSLRILK